MTSPEPSWKRTNVRWEIRKLIWRRWSLGDTIANTLAFFELRQTDKDLKDAPTDRNTIAKVRDELAHVPLEVLLELVKEMPEIATFLRQQRPDFNEKQGLGKVSESENWIDDYFGKHGEELPFIPDWLAPIVIGYSQGMRVSKEIKLGYSPPYWDNLKPSQRKQVLQLVEWLGQDKDDYIDMIDKYKSGRPGQIRIIWKR